MPDSSGPLTPADEHEDCRLRLWANWTRVMLEHERAYLSSVMAGSAAFMPQEEQAGIMHEVGDIDWLLSLLDEPMKVKT